MSHDARSTLILAVLAGGLVLAITIVSDALLDLTRPITVWPYLIDDTILSALGGCVVWFYERHRRRELAKRLFVIAEMNHRVRNELQVIQYSAYATKEKEHITIIGESVAKIEASLSEILEDRKPGQKTPRTPGATPTP